MITGVGLLKELENVKKKAEFVEITYPNNSLWPLVNERLEKLISLIKNDKKIYGW